MQAGYNPVAPQIYLPSPDCWASTDVCRPELIKNSLGTNNRPILVYEDEHKNYQISRPNNLNISGQFTAAVSTYWVVG